MGSFDESVNEFNKEIGKRIVQFVFKIVLVLLITVGIIVYVIKQHRQEVELLDIDCAKYSQETGECIEFKYVPMLKE